MNTLHIFKSLCLFAAFSVCALPAQAADSQSAHQNGKKMHADKCASCHDEKSGLGDGNVLYLRSDRKVRNPKQLESMVARCNSELRLDLFPEDEAEIVAFLNQKFYKFPPPKP
jgi:hypothetical protein